MKWNDREEWERIFGQSVVVLVVVLIALLVAKCSFAFDQFPDVKESEAIGFFEDKRMGLFWKVYDLNGDGLPECAKGYKPKSVTEVPQIMFNPMTGQMMVRVKKIPNIEGLNPVYYWLDKNGDGNGSDIDGLSLDEFLYDPKMDGFNGNEKKAYPLLNGDEV